jgi:hypothetical protein
VSGDLMLLSMLKSWRFLHSQCILCWFHTFHGVS